MKTENGLKTHPYTKYQTHLPEKLSERVDFIMEGIRHSVECRPEEDSNAANIRHMNDFFSFLNSHFPKDRFQSTIQQIPKAKIRTTDRNFIVTVPGRSMDKIVLVAHYDTWTVFSRHAPGADDNTTGEELLKHYLLLDLCSDAQPELSHVYLFSGSEECGTRGLRSQLFLTIGLTILGYAISTANWLALLFALPFLPLAYYRIGITGARHFVESLSAEDKASIRAAIAVDSIGEGRLYILENEMGANFLRAFYPYKGSEKLNDLLKEGAHLHGIKYNSHLAGGTTDSVAFLEERGFIPRDRKEKHIPAAALITMSPGKSSPFVAGGKLHTRHDTYDRIHPESIQEVLIVLDYTLRILQGGSRPMRPRRLSEHHYGRLYRAGSDLFFAAKDAVEPNRRNINSIFRVHGEITDRKACFKTGDVVRWGVKTTLDKEMKEFLPTARQVAVNQLTIEEDGKTCCFATPRSLFRRLQAWPGRVLGLVERFMGRFPMFTMFIVAVVVSDLPNRILMWTVIHYPVLGMFVLRNIIAVVFAMLLFQLLVLFRIFTKELPAAMDNAYRHENRADNMVSLIRSHDPEV